jgi:hypothetical protein
MWGAIPKCESFYQHLLRTMIALPGRDHLYTADLADMEAKYDAEVELHRRKQIAFTVIRPGGLTTESAGGVTMGKTALGKTRWVRPLPSLIFMLVYRANVSAANSSQRPSSLLPVVQRPRACQLMWWTGRARLRLSWTRW